MRRIEQQTKCCFSKEMNMFLLSRLLLLFALNYCEAKKFVSDYSNHHLHHARNIKIDGDNKTMHQHHKTFDDNSFLAEEREEPEGHEGGVGNGQVLNHVVVVDKKPVNDKILGTITYPSQTTKLRGNTKLNRTCNTQEKVLLVSLDGFRWDFREKTATPNLDKVAEEGVSVNFVLNVFPTVTLPNHQSIVTGLYPENHGMISNTMLDPDTGRTFDANTEAHWWNQSRPIWIANQQQGHQSGVSFWPGFRVRYDGMLPAYLPQEKYARPGEEHQAVVEKNNARIMPITQRITQCVDWLKNDDVTFVALYIETVDKTVHEQSPDSASQTRNQSVLSAIRKVDANIGLVAKLLNESNLTSKVNVIIIGDHGASNAHYKKQLLLDDYVDMNDVKRVDGMTSAFIFTKRGKKKVVYKRLREASRKKDAHFRVYLKQDIPDYFHVKKNRRTGNILVLPDPGWIVVSKSHRPPYLKGEWKRGEHGYSNFESAMQPAFLAYGPAFKSGYKQWCVKTVDVYSLMCRILNIKPAKNDGNFNRVKPMLKEFEGTDVEQVKDEKAPLIC